MIFQPTSAMDGVGLQSLLEITPLQGLSQIQTYAPHLVVAHVVMIKRVVTCILEFPEKIPESRQVLVAIGRGGWKQFPRE